MKVIYEPEGAAREYAPLAANIYRGCVNGCRYCYVPGILRMSPDAFHARVQARPGVLEALTRDAHRLRADQRAVHLCFTCDPWPPDDQFLVTEPDWTGAALEVLVGHDLRVSTLTKTPGRARDHLDLLKAAHAHFGVSLSWVDDAKRVEWEPGHNQDPAMTVDARLAGLEMARSAGLSTWASVEPVIDPDEALAAILLLSQVCDEIRVGRWNHSAEANAIDWRAFALEADRMLRAWGKPYILKRGLAELIR